MLDPIGGDWATEYVYDDPALFLEDAQSTENCMLVVDEAGAMIGQYDREMFWLATQARHRGHGSVFITQRPAQVNPTVRGQCEVCYCFQIDPKASEVLAADFNEPVLREAPALPRGTCIKAEAFQPAQRIEVFQTLPPLRAVPDATLEDTGT